MPGFFEFGYFNLALVATGTDLRSGLQSRLLSISALTAIVGSNLFPGVVPETVNLLTQPALTYRVITDPREFNLGGHDGIAAARVQISMHSATYSQCAAGAAAVWSTAGLRDFTGALGGGPIVIGVFLENEVDAEEFADDASARVFYSIHQDYLIRYREP